MFNAAEAQRVVKALPGILRGNYPPPEGTDPTFVDHILTGAGTLVYLMHHPASPGRDEGLLRATLEFMAVASYAETEELWAWIDSLKDLITGSDDDPAVLSVLGSTSQVASGRDN